MPKINGNEIKPGNIIQHNDEIWVAVKTSHVKHGKGGAFVMVELKKQYADKIDFAKAGTLLKQLLNK